MMGDRNSKMAHFIPGLKMSNGVHMLYSSLKKSLDIMGSLEPLTWNVMRTF